MGWLFGKTYSVRCRDGSIKEVYRSVDVACPLYIPGVEREVSAKGSGTAKSVGLSLKGEAKKKYEKKIEALVFGIDELTQTVMINFRSVYLAFSSDPCSNNSFFLRQVEMLVGEQQRIAKLRIQAGTLISLVQAQPDNVVEIMGLFKQLALNIGGNLGAEVIKEEAKKEINEARQLADDWAGK